MGNVGEEELGLQFYDEVRTKSADMITDLLHKIDAYGFQELVAGLLRAAGYRTRESPPGPDGGIDIRAFPDLFGFGSPRIRVQVKHRRGPPLVCRKSNS